MYLETMHLSLAFQALSNFKQFQCIIKYIKSSSKSMAQVRKLHAVNQAEGACMC